MPREPPVDPADLVNIERLVEQGLNNVVEHGEATGDDGRDWEYMYDYDDTRLLDFWDMYDRPDGILEVILRRCVKQRFPNIHLLTGQFSLHRSRQRFELNFSMTFSDKRTMIPIRDLHVVFSYLIWDRDTNEMWARSKFTIENYELLPGGHFGQR